MNAIFSRLVCLLLLASAIGCAAQPFTGGPGPSPGYAGAYGTRYRQSNYDSNDEAQRAAAARQRANNQAAAALGLLVVGAMVAGSGSGSSNSDDDGFRCPNCGSPADSFVGYCGRCASMMNEQMQGR